MHRSVWVKDVLWPALFIASMGYLVWYFPKFFVFFGWANNALVSKYAPAGALDFAILAFAAVVLILGIMKTDATSGEGGIESPFDRVSLFFGRVAMFLIALLVSVMFYEVVLRYVFENPTLWANELSLWVAGFIFLLAGLYGMQQRSHIRIYLLYDAMPRALQRLCDTVSAILIMVFALAMIYGSYNEAYAKFMRWETFGTAFDPPIPATLKPLVLLIIFMVAVQALFNLFADWNKLPEHHGVIDEEEVEDIIQSLEDHGEPGGKK
jgi:TRAP-type C4-dicarboxylate transport system permease small subunit